jgi:NAD-dependent SIR2 family protein deacetylase
VRKRQQKRRPDDDAEAEKAVGRFGIFTPLVSNLFQKCGVPSDEVYEPCGNVFQWQCSALPPCSS